MIQYEYEKLADKKEYITLQKYKKSDRNRCALHFHNSVEFVFMLSGRCTLKINSEERVLKPGDIGFMNGFDPHLYLPFEDTDYYVVLISSDFFDRINNLGSISYDPFISGGEGFAVIKRFLDFSYENWNADSAPFLYGFANMLLGLMQTYYPSHQKERDKQNEIIISSMKYVNEHFCEDISVEELATKFGYTPNYFSTVFNRFTGMSFREYLNRCRISRFAVLTKENPDLPAYKAAEECGFKSLNTFYRAYNKYN